VTFGHCEVPLQVLCALPMLVWPAHRALCIPTWLAERTVWPQTTSRIHTGCIKGRGTSPGPPQRLPWSQSANACDEHTDRHHVYTTFAVCKRRPRRRRAPLPLVANATQRASPFPFRATKRKEKDNRARVPGSVSATTLGNTRALFRSTRGKELGLWLGTWVFVGRLGFVTTPV
jgi:hypothetical protein